MATKFIVQVIKKIVKKKKGAGDEEDEDDDMQMGDGKPLTQAEINAMKDFAHKMIDKFFDNNPKLAASLHQAVDELAKEAEKAITPDAPTSDKAKEDTQSASVDNAPEKDSEPLSTNDMSELKDVLSGHTKDENGETMSDHIKNNTETTAGDKEQHEASLDEKLDSVHSEVSHDINDSMGMSPPAPSGGTGGN